jgi:hypothetical protein
MIEGCWWRNQRLPWSNERSLIIQNESSIYANLLHVFISSTQFLLILPAHSIQAPLNNRNRKASYNCIAASSHAKYVSECGQSLLNTHIHIPVCNVTM